MHRNKTMIRKIFVGLGGGVTILLGLILIPTPAPEGWLIVFAGIALLSTEFSFAKRWLKQVKALRVRIDRWIQRQPRIVRVGLGILGGVVVVGIVTATVLAILLTVKH